MSLDILLLLRFARSCIIPPFYSALSYEYPAVIASWIYPTSAIALWPTYRKDLLPTPPLLPPTTLGTFFHLIPTVFPLLSPSKRAATHRADLSRPITFFHREAPNRLVRNEPSALKTSLQMALVH